MFARGSWAIFGIKSDSEAAFVKSLDDFIVPADKVGSITGSINQAAAVQKAKNDNIPTYGINHYDFPRLDGRDALSDITSDAFKLSDYVYGFWFCLNGFEDVTDPKSKQEALAYEHFGKPFKFLKKEEKQHVDWLGAASP